MRPRLYVRTWPYFLSCTLADERTCTGYVRASTTTRARLYIYQYICMYTFATRMTTLRTLRPGGSRLSGTSLPAKMYLVGPSSQGANCFFCPDALPCVRRCSCWVPAVRGGIVFFARTHFLVCEDVAGGSHLIGGHFFRKIQLPVQWVPAVRWMNHYFTCNKEAFPCCGRGPSCQPLHVQYSFNGSRSLPMLTTPR